MYISFRLTRSTYTPEEFKRPLSERGVKDVKQVTDLLTKESIDAVFSSFFKRAIQIIEGIAKRFNLQELKLSLSSESEYYVNIS